MALKITDDIKKALKADALAALEEAAKETDIFVGSGANYIPQTRFDEVNQQAKDQKARADKFEKDVADLTKNAKSQEDLTKQIADLTAANTKQKEDYDKTLAERDLNYLINDGLREAKARNSKAVLGLLDRAKISVKDGSLVGFKEQIDALQKSDAYLFGEESPKPKIDRFGHVVEDNQINGGTKSAIDIVMEQMPGVDRAKVESLAGAKK